MQYYNHNLDFRLVTLDFILTINRNVVKAFYTAGMLLEVCSTFGEASEEIAQQKK